MDGKFFLIILLLLILYISDMPFISIPAALFIHVFFLGFVARTVLVRGTGNIIFESIILSLIITVAMALFLGNFLEVGGIISRVIVGTFILALVFLRTKEVNPTITELRINLSKEKWNIVLLFFLAAVPFFIIFLLNPIYALISDGWWHCSIYNTIELGKLPPQNPWYLNEPLGYPYAYHIYMSYARGTGLSCFDGINLFDYLATAIAMFGLYLLGKETFNDEKIGLATAFSFLFVSHLGGLGFIYDLIRILPSGLDNYLSFLKSVHGPHVYYGHMDFLGFGGVVIPFQMATMMAAFHFPLLVGLLYFLLKKQRLIVGIALAALFVTNPIVGIFGGLITAAFILGSSKLDWKELKSWIPYALVAIILVSNYVYALLDKQTVIEGEVVDKPVIEKLTIGFLVGYAPLIIFTVLFFLGKKDYRNLWLTFLIAALAAIILLRKGTTYIYTDLSILFSITSAPLLVKFMNEPKKYLLLGVLFAILLIPTFLVVGSYAYYKVPLSQSEVSAAQWLKENTPSKSVFLVTMNFSKDWNLHQYVPAFGSRFIYFGDPTLLKIYGEDINSGMAMYKKIIEEKDESSICKATSNGIDFIYTNNGEEFNGNCVLKVYENSQIKIYATK